MASGAAAYQQQLHVPPRCCRNLAVVARRLGARISRVPVPRAVHAVAPSAAESICIPPATLQRLQSASGSWIHACRSQPLVDGATGVRIFLLGVCHFAPFLPSPHATSLHDLIQDIQPAAIALELPLVTPATSPHAAAGPGAGPAGRPRLLPYPAFVESFMAAWDHLPASGSEAEAAGPTSPPHSEELQGLRQELDRSCIEAKVGRDVLDPYELFGFYPSLDFVTSPDQIRSCLDLFGFLPGLEYGAAVREAQAQGAQVFCIDAPLRLQETWVRDILSTFRFSAREAQVQERLRAGDAQALQRMVPDDLRRWDLGLPEQVAVRVAGLPPSQQQLHTMTAFKVARACAAAGIPAPAAGAGGASTSGRLPEPGPGRRGAGAWEEVLERQARLQPLKHRHAERRTLYLGQQLQEVCGRVAAAARAAARGAKDRGEAGGTGISTGGVRPSAPGGAGGQGGERTAAGPAILVVLGRQYVSGLRALWADQASALYHGAVPRTFATSALEPGDRGTGLDPDVEHGGSRPVGQRVMSFGGGSVPPGSLNPGEG